MTYHAQPRDNAPVRQPEVPAAAASITVSNAPSLTSASIHSPADLRGNTQSTIANTLVAQIPPVVLVSHPVAGAAQTTTTAANGAAVTAPSVAGTTPPPVVLSTTSNSHNGAAANQPQPGSGAGSSASNNASPQPAPTNGKTPHPDDVVGHEDVTVRANRFDVFCKYAAGQNVPVSYSERRPITRGEAEARAKNANPNGGEADEGLANAQQQNPANPAGTVVRVKKDDEFAGTGTHPVAV